jgi:hypothetical protein
MSVVEGRASTVTILIPLVRRCDVLRNDAAFHQVVAVRLANGLWKLADGRYVDLHIPDVHEVTRIA